MTIPTEYDPVESLVRPETDLERRIISDPEWLEGAFWGTPRRGHPEGEVIFHIREVLDNVDKIAPDPELRSRLRLITIIHDTFKYLEDRSFPRKVTRHHAFIAWRFAKQYIHDQGVLDCILLHDNVYYAWLAAEHGLPDIAAKFLRKTEKRMGKDMLLYHLFFKCDTLTGDKTLTPVHWFEEILEHGYSVNL